MTLTRLKYNEDSTQGVLKLNDKMWYTLELKYDNNRRNVSCIPEGVYNYKKVKSKKRGYYVIQLSGTGLRTYIQIHIGNRTSDILGCVLVGMIGSKDTVSQSTQAFNELMKEAPDSGVITIKSI